MICDLVCLSVREEWHSNFNFHYDNHIFLIPKCLSGCAWFLSVLGGDGGGVRGGGETPSRFIYIS